MLGIGTTLVAACGPSGAGSSPTTAPAPAAQPTAAPAAAKPTTAPAAAPTTAPAAQPTSAPAAAPTAQAAPAQTGANLTGTITVSYPDEAGKKPPYVQAAADQVTKANPSAKVTVDLQKIADGDYYTKLLLALQSGSGPDVTHLGGDSIGEMVDANYLAPLDDYLAKWADWKLYPDAVKQGVTYKGKVYGIPYGLDTRFLYYRKDVFQKAGIDPTGSPRTSRTSSTRLRRCRAKCRIDPVPALRRARPRILALPVTASCLPLWALAVTCRTRVASGSAIARRCERRSPTISRRIRRPNWFLARC